MKNFKILEATPLNMEKIEKMSKSQSFLEDVADGGEFRDKCLGTLSNGNVIDSGVFVNRQGQFYATVLNKHERLDDMRVLYHIIAETDDKDFVDFCASQDG